MIGGGLHQQFARISGAPIGTDIKLGNLAKGTGRVKRVTGRQGHGANDFAITHSKIGGEIIWAAQQVCGDCAGEFHNITAAQLCQKSTDHVSDDAGVFGFCASNLQGHGELRFLSSGSQQVIEMFSNQKLIGSYHQNFGGAVSQIHLDLDHLQLLDAVARTGSLARSAVLLGLTQPALSYRLKEAERRLGVPLFVKAQGRKVQMTAAAARLLPTASMVLREVARAEEDIRRLSDGIHYLLRLGVESRSGFLWLPKFLARLGREHPELEVDLVCEPSRAGLEALVRNQIDLAVVLAGEIGPAFTARSLFDDELVAVVPVGHALAERPWLEALDFADQALVTDEPWGDGGVHAAAVLVPAGVRPARMVGAGSARGVVDMVEAGFGLGIVSRRLAQDRGRAVTLTPIGRKGFQTRWQVVVRSEEEAGSPASFMAERMSYWCEGADAASLPLVTQSVAPA